ncbi:MAG: DUF4956 domain-containing protein [Thermomicrobiales bacterium]
MSYLATAHIVTIATDLVAIAVLVFGIHFPRHRNRDMVVAYLSINVGVLAIAAALSSVNASVSLGIGLFGVLSIIRLRSDELSQRQVGYYFGSLALGLLGGTKVDTPILSIALMLLLVGVLWFADHPRLLGRYRVQLLTVDRAFIDERELASYLGTRIGGEIRGVTIRRADFVNDTTLVDVRYEVPVLLDQSSANRPSNPKHAGEMVYP